MTYLYRIEGAVGAARAEPAVSAVLTSEAVTPAEDPYPPEALVLINGGARSTSELDVTLTFAPYEGEGENPLQAFEDIVEVKISNDPSFASATWQPFESELPWHLDAEWGQMGTVYVLFRDDVDNESVAPETDSILYVHSLYLPVVLRAY
jgi:hypothetical protein